MGKTYDFFTQEVHESSAPLTAEQQKQASQPTQKAAEVHESSAPPTAEQPKQASQTTQKAAEANQPETTADKQSSVTWERTGTGPYFQNRVEEMDEVLGTQTGIDKYIRMAAIEEAPRFEYEGRQIQQTYERSQLELDYRITGSAPFGYEYQYTTEEAKEYGDLLEKLHGKLPSMTVQPRNAYMSEEEQRIYYTLLGAYGGKTAKEYYLLIRNDLNQRQGIAEVEKILEEENDLLRFVQKTLYAAETGVNNSIQNLAQHFTDGELPVLPGNYGLQMIRENSTKLGAMWYGAIESTARQAPSLIMKGLTGSAAIGYVFSFLDVSGSAYAQKKQEGASDIEARLYSILAGSSDIIVDKLLGGFGESTGLTEAKFLKKADQLDNIFTRVVAKTAVEIGSEITEEELQLFVEPAIESALYGKDYDAPNWEEMVETALTTAIATGLQRAPGIAVNEVKNQKTRSIENANGGNTKAGDAGKSAASTADADAAAKNAPEDSVKTAKPAPEADAPAVPGEQTAKAPEDSVKTAKPAPEADAPAVPGEQTAKAPEDSVKTAKPAPEADAPAVPGEQTAKAPEDPGKTAKPTTEADAPAVPGEQTAKAPEDSVKTAKPAPEADSPAVPAEQTAKAPEDSVKTAKPATEADAPAVPAEQTAKAPEDSVKTAKPAPEADAPAVPGEQTAKAPEDSVKTAKPAPEADAPAASKTDLEALRKELAEVEGQLFSLGMDDTYGPEVEATEEGGRLLERKAALESEIAETERALAQEAKEKTAQGETVESAEETEVDSPDDQTYNKDKARLPEDQWTKLKNETGWPAEILNYIRSMEEAAIYQKENLTPKKVDGRWALVMDIDMDYVDPRSHLTNRQLIAIGRSPKDSKTGETIELHHLGQEFDSPFVELSASAHRGAENNLTLHPTREDSWRNDWKKKREYRKEKRQHWKTRKNNTNEGSIKHETQKNAEGIGTGYQIYDRNKGPDPGG